VSAVPFMADYFMERYGWTYTQFEGEMGDHPSEMGVLWQIGIERNKEETRQMGKSKMGNQLEGSKRDVKLWRKGRSNDSKGTVMSGQSALRKKFPAMYGK